MSASVEPPRAPAPASQRDGRLEFALFVLAGGTSAIVNVLARMALSLAMPYEAAVVAAYLFGMTTAFLLNKRFVFAASGRRATGEYLRFGLVNLAGIVQVWIVSVGLLRLVFPAIGFAWHGETVAHVAGLLVPTVTSYYGHKHFSFAGRSG